MQSKPTFGAIVFAALFAAAVVAQPSPAPTGTPVHMIVTVEARHGASVPVINREDAMVYEGHDRDTVTDWIPLQGDRAALELFIMIDDSSTVSLGSQLEDIRQFINSAPATTKIGVAYMQNGGAQIVQNLTDDHAQAAKSLRLPLGNPGANSSPYFSLQDLIKRWPQGTARREVVMITDGIDRYYGSGPDDPYVTTAVEQAQKAGIIVFGIYTPGIGHYGHSYWSTYWGQIYLAQVAEETGGEGYYIGFNGPAVTFVPYLTEIGQRLNRQYLLGFLAKPQKKAGMQRVRLSTEVPNAELVGPSQVFVPATQ
jgi:hypothetical protein